jgi:fumarate hydratase subunit alpha/L(+)-tartrate dehydratase alpha subunit
VKVDLQQVEEAAKELYIRALKLLPPDVKQGFDRLARSETDAGARRMLGTMVANIKVAEDRDSLLCQDTGVPVYNVSIGRGVEVDGAGLREAIRRGCARSTREYSFRSSIVHPTTRVNDQTSTGRGVPVINFDFSDAEDVLEIEMIPKGSGSENNSWLRMAVPAEGVDAIKTFVVDCVLEAGGKTCRRRSSASAWAAPPTCACTSRSSPRRGRSARVATTRGREARAGARQAVNCSASGRRGSAAIPPRSRCTWRPRRRTSP